MPPKLATESQSVGLWKTGNYLQVEAPEASKIQSIGIN